MAPYTGPETRIIMSFAMKSGGHLFSQWLRNRLMKELDYFSPNAIYVDTVASREHATEHSLAMPDPATHKAGTTYVAPDRRHEATEGFTTIGAMNRGWNHAYQTAMRQAHVMLFLMTPDYVASQWCVQEWNQFLAEAKGRGPNHRLFGLVLCFNDSGGAEIGTGAIPSGFDPSVMQKLAVTRIETGRGHQTAIAHGRGWAIGESDVGRILQAIRPHLPA